MIPILSLVTLVPESIPGMVLGTRVLKYTVDIGNHLRWFDIL